MTKSGQHQYALTIKIQKSSASLSNSFVIERTAQPTTVNQTGVLAAERVSGAVSGLNCPLTAPLQCKFVEFLNVYQLQSLFDQVIIRLLIRNSVF